jgi:hypothetical protein
MTWQIALAIAAALFGALIVWQNRPSFGGLGGPPGRNAKARRQALADARARLAAATSPGDRARALCDAGDASVFTLASMTSALGYYLRAMRTDPTSVEPIERAARGLARRPRTLESVLWRRLGGHGWDGPNRPAALAALTELARIYAGSLRNRSRAHAIAHALVALGQPLPPGTIPNPVESTSDLAPPAKAPAG